MTDDLTMRVALDGREYVAPVDSVCILLRLREQDDGLRLAREYMDATVKRGEITLA